MDASACVDLPLIDLDPERLRQVLSNLLTNALRYTPSGGMVRVGCNLAAQSSQVELSVSDTGAGIRPEDLPHVFDRFYKAVDSGGMGLGLAIARRLVEAHGGEIRAESQPGQGTTMRITLPLSDQKTN